MYCVKTLYLLYESSSLVVAAISDVFIWLCPPGGQRYDLVPRLNPPVVGVLLIGAEGSVDHG